MRTRMHKNVKDVLLVVTFVLACATPIVAPNSQRPRAAGRPPNPSPAHSAGLDRMSRLNRLKVSPSSNPKSLLTDNERDARLSFNIQKHQSCHMEEPLPTELIRFPSSNTSTLHERSDKPGCYYIQGPVQVFKDIDKDLQMYVELRTDLNPNKPPEKCKDADEDGCGGYGGSCIQCNGCKQARKHEEKIDLAEASLTVDGEKPTCGDTLKAGTYKNVQLSFCLPSKKQYLDAMGYDDETWQSLMEATSGQHGRTSAALYMRVYIFNFKVASLMATQRKLEADQEKRMINNGQLQEGERLPINMYKNLPFSRFIYSTQVYAGCHVLRGTVALEKNDLNK